MESVLEAYLLHAYVTTGKDTFFKQLVNTTDIPFNWYVYHLRDVHPLNISELIAKEPVRVSYADLLRKMTAVKLGIPLTTDFESIKTKVYESPTGTMPFREHMMKVDEVERAKNEFYCSDEIFDNNYLGHLDLTTIVITDWKYINDKRRLEERGYKTYSIRLFSTSVPDSKYPFDHLLDDYTTDYVLIRDGDNLPMETVWQMYYKNFARGDYVEN